MPGKKKTVISKTSQNVLADGRHVVGVVREHRAEFAKADEKKKRKLVDEPTLKRWESDIVVAESANAGQKVFITVSVEATAEEVQARAAVHDHYVQIKGDVELRLGDHPEVASAYGFHTPVIAHSTPSVLDASETVIEAWKRGNHHGLLGEAGVTAEVIDALKVARARLAAADSAQKIAQSSGVGHTLGKREALRTVRANTAHIRKIARHVFRKRPEVLKKFKSRLPRYTPIPRTTKQAPPVEQKGAEAPVAPVVALPVDGTRPPPAARPRVKRERKSQAHRFRAKAKGRKRGRRKAKALAGASNRRAA
jgi:hypothetical protein